MLTARRLRDDEISRRAAALTYYTLLSLVPVLAVAFALFKAFGGLKRLEEPLRDFIVDNLAVGSAEKVEPWINDFINNINAGAIAGVSVLVLFYSAIGLLTNIEQSFNRVWNIDRMRPVAQRFVIYWSIMTLGPTLLAVALALSGQVRNAAVTHAAVSWLSPEISQFLFSLISELAISFAFVLVYMLVPNTKVHFRCAMLGGLVAGALWTLSKMLFLWMTSRSAQYSAIYGALSALPLLMLWLYYSWLITLFGATYAFANQTIASYNFEAKSLGISQVFREKLAARLMVEVAQAYHQGQKPPTIEALAKRTGALVTVVQNVMQVLMQHELIRETYDAEIAGYVPGRDLATLTLDHVISVLRQNDGTALSLNHDDASQRVFQLLEQASAASHTILKQTNLLQLAESSSEHSIQKI